MNRKLSVLLAAVLFTAPAFAQYTPGTGGTYTPPPRLPIPVQPTPPQPQPGQPSYTWEVPPGGQPLPQPQPALVPVQPDAVRIVQAPGPYIEVAQGVYIPRLSDQQLSELTAAIALYPDPLLAEMLPATTFVEELCYADRWLSQHPNPDEASIAALSVAPSVKTLIHFPGVLQQMVGYVDWTQALGMAFLYQRNEVMESIQRWRITAVAAGTLFSTPQQDVLRQGNHIMILPPQRAQTVYVPVYDPAVVYMPPPYQPRTNLISFSVGGLSLRWIQNDVDWRERQVRVPAWDGPYDGRGRGRGDRTAFVRDARPGGMSYPHRAVMPQPDKKVITLPSDRDNPGRGRGPQGRGNPGRGPGSPF